MGSEMQHRNTNIANLEKCLPKQPVVETDDARTIDELVANRGAFICGFPGSGKTHLALQLANRSEFKKVLMLSFTNAAVNNFRTQCTREDVTSYTFDMFLHNSHEKGADMSSRFLNYDCILIDECAMCDYKLHMLALYKAYIKCYGNNTDKQNVLNKFPSVYMFGDSNQCRILNGPHQYDYENCSCVQTLCRFKHIEMSYKEAYSRYDLETYQFLQNFKKTKTLQRDVFSEIDIRIPTNICYTNQKRNQINATLFANISNGEYVDNTPIIALQKFGVGTRNIYKNERFQYADIPSNIVKKYTELAFGMTVYKAQGQTITTDYNVHELNHPLMNFNFLYTMFSRAQSLAQIHVSNDTIKCTRVYKMQSAQNQTSVVMNLMSNASIGYCYKILNQNGEIIYIGITERSVNTRWLEHIEPSYKRTREIIDVDVYLLDNHNYFSCSCVEIGAYSISCRKELEILEGLLITHHISENPNHLLMNKDKMTIAPTPVDLDKKTAITQVEPLVRKRKLVVVDEINYSLYNKKNITNPKQKKKISITKEGKEWTRTYNDSNFEEILEIVKTEFAPYVLKGNNWN
jgi:hypothetical protein